VTRERLSFEEALSLIGLSGRFVGEFPQAPSHLRLKLAGRAIIWPLEANHSGVTSEIRRAVADMVANTSLLSRSGRDLQSWADAVGLDPTLARTEAAFEMAVLLDGFAEHLLTRRVLEGLLEGTTWRNYLQDLHPAGFMPARIEGQRR
jgi:hypothetical protein